MKLHSGIPGYRRVAAVALVSFFGTVAAFTAGCNATTPPGTSPNDGAAPGAAACAGSTDVLNQAGGALSNLTNLLSQNQGNSGLLDPNNILGGAIDQLQALALNNTSPLSTAQINSLVDQLTPLLTALDNPALPIQPSALSTILKQAQLTDLAGQLKNLSANGTTVLNPQQTTCILTRLLGIGADPGLTGDVPILGILGATLGLPGLSGSSDPVTAILGALQAPGAAGNLLGPLSSLGDALQVSSITNLLSSLGSGSSPIDPSILTGLLGQLTSLGGGNTSSPLNGLTSALQGLLSGAGGSPIDPSQLTGILGQLPSVLGTLPDMLQLSSLTNVLGGLAGGSSPVDPSQLTGIASQLTGLLGTLGGGSSNPLTGVISQLTSLGGSSSPIDPSQLTGLVSTLQGLLGGLSP